MNQYQTDHNVSLPPAQPLFASVWLALFTELGKNYVEWRLASEESDSKGSIKS